MQEFFKKDSTVDELNKMVLSEDKLVIKLPKEYFSDFEDNKDN